MAEELNLEDIENLDLDLGDGSMKMPSKQELLKMLEEANMTDEMKENMKNLLGGGGAPQLFGTTGGGTWLGLVFIVLIFSLLFFFGYKLYKSIKEKEIKREEKKKAKQMKKKK